jgi:uncharacterized protein (TIGR03437 family)
MRTAFLLTVIITTCTISLGQSVNTIVGSSYSLPESLKGAPGQIVTIYVTNVAIGLTEPLRAEATPLPTRLGNISVSLNRSDVFLPLISIQPLGNIAAITLQIPYNLSFRAEDIRQRFLIVHEGDKASDPVFLETMTNRIHIVSTCDAIFITRADSCQPVITHGDGRLVSQRDPARAGEALIAYALGLGDTNPSASTGVPAAQPAQPRTPVELSFDFTPNAPPVDVRRLMGATVRPLYVGLVPGLIGLYQINFTVPDIPRQVARCGGSTLSNLTVSMGQLPVPNALGSPGSFTGAGICVQPSENMAVEMIDRREENSFEELFFSVDDYLRLKIEKQANRGIKLEDKFKDGEKR